MDQSEEDPPAAEKPKAGDAPSQPAAQPDPAAKSKDSSEKLSPDSKSKVEESPAAKRIAEALVPQTTQAGSGTKYDVLYFDANHDLDLTNDSPVKLMKDPPKGLPTGANYRVFDTISVEIPISGGAPLKVRLIPMFQVFQAQTYTVASPAEVGAPVTLRTQFNAYLRLMPPTVRKGKVQLGKQEYTAILIPAGQITGRLDDPKQTRLQLFPLGEGPGEAATSTGWTSWA